MAGYFSSAKRCGGCGELVDYDSLGVEPVAEPVVGFRAWRLIEGELCPIGVPPQRWVPPVAKAVHVPVPSWTPHDLVEPHRSPHPGCACGFWALKKPSYIPTARLYVNGPAVVGLVELWGRVVQHSLGWRGEYVRPKGNLVMHRTYRHYEGSLVRAAASWGCGYVFTSEADPVDVFMGVEATVPGMIRDMSQTTEGDN